MSGTQEPSESNDQWAAPSGPAQVATGQFQQLQPNPLGPDVQPDGAYAPAPGQQLPHGQTQAWAQPNLGASVPNPYFPPQYPPQPWGAQPGYPQAQFGGGPPNQWVPAPGPSSGDKMKPWMWVGIGLLAGFAIAALVLLVSGAFGAKTLDEVAVEEGVDRIVTESYGARTVTNVRCPSGQKVELDASFDCILTVDGKLRTVTVTVTDSDGTYEVSRPK
ncbi:DUF4333 domain-containing protein [Rhodococcus spongiicola]|uniref:DUF4333 domain-containing protein n=1 Tax=Rhodococcus spongiicola TaxID=2487352 RepID=A0A438AX69_9NOCA|nr:DUF4333 domain-containing protein [Rhodococcus spongiicola]RVW03289.1 DUF4333 domain-containing protein [Rhodococcus spongiicola]